ncbi:hypothetical protein HDU96_008926 [Phlyctochytrium bullatum]|nr:hypothetical protein HDU96_008926 [Phlyctochytrium bullatum]
MPTYSLTATTFTLHLTAAERILAAHTAEEISFPLASVELPVMVRPEASEFYGWRVGTHLPGVFLAGTTYHNDRKRDFVYLGKVNRSIAIKLRDHPKLLHVVFDVEGKEPEEAAREIEDAVRHVTTAETSAIPLVSNRVHQAVGSYAAANAPVALAANSAAVHSGYKVPPAAPASAASSAAVEISDVDELDDDEVEPPAAAAAAEPASEATPVPNTPAAIPKATPVPGEKAPVAATPVPEAGGHGAVSSPCATVAAASPAAHATATAVPAAEGAHGATVVAPAAGEHGASPSVASEKAPIATNAEPAAPAVPVTPGAAEPAAPTVTPIAAEPAAPTVTPIAAEPAASTVTLGAGEGASPSSQETAPPVGAEQAVTTSKANILVTSAAVADFRTGPCMLALLMVACGAVTMF